MTWEEAFKIVGAVIASLGGATFLILAFSSWLGKVWADRLMAYQQLKNEQELAKLRANLQRENHLDLEKIKTELAVLQQRHLRGFSDKLSIYQIVTDLYSDFVADIVWALKNNTKIPIEKIIAYDKMRMKVFGYLCLYSTQEAIDAHEKLVESVSDTLIGTVKLDWSEFRTRATNLLNIFRKDIDPNAPDVIYRGDR